jgi:hypothetical protein
MNHKFILIQSLILALLALFVVSCDFIMPFTGVNGGGTAAPTAAPTAVPTAVPTAGPGVAPGHELEGSWVFNDQSYAESYTFAGSTLTIVVLFEDPQLFIEFEIINIDQDNDSVTLACKNSDVKLFDAESAYTLSYSIDGENAYFDIGLGEQGPYVKQQS